MEQVGSPCTLRRAGHRGALPGRLARVGRLVEHLLVTEHEHLDAARPRPARRGEEAAAVGVRADIQGRAGRRAPARGIGASGAAGLGPDFFSLEDSAVRKLLEDYPLARGGPAQVVIIGFGASGQAMLREIARQQLAWHGGPRVEVFVRDASEPDVQQVTHAFPAIGYGRLITCGQGS
jgi:hypothetical protein